MKTKLVLSELDFRQKLIKKAYTFKETMPQLVFNFQCECNL